MELIVSNKEDFDTLRPFSGYCSERTGVIEIRNDSLQYVLENYKDLITKYTNVSNTVLDDNKPEMIESKGKLYVSGADEGLSVYLDLPFSKEVKLDSLGKLFDLLANGIIKPSSNLLPKLGPLTEDDELSKLLSSNYSTNHNHKRMSLAKLDGCHTIKDLDFAGKTIDVKKYKVYKYLTIKALRETPSETYKFQVICENKYGEVELRFFYLTPSQKSLFTPGTTICAMAEKVYGGKSKKILITPEIVPYSFPKEFFRTELKTSKRNIPVKLLRAAYAEYSYRNNLQTPALEENI